MSDFEPQLAVKKERIRPINGPGVFWLLIILVLFLLALSVFLFGQSDQPSTNGGVIETETPTPTPTESVQAKIYTISYKSGVFSPTNLRIHAGDTVRFKNDNILPIRIVSADIVGFDSMGDIPQGSYFSFTFAAKGIFEYHNAKNTKEAGSIIVR